MKYVAAFLIAQAIMLVFCLPILKIGKEADEQCPTAE